MKFDSVLRVGLAGLLAWMAPTHAGTLVTQTHAHTRYSAFEIPDFGESGPQSFLDRVDDRVVNPLPWTGRPPEPDWWKRNLLSVRAWTHAYVGAGTIALGAGCDVSGRLARLAADYCSSSASFTSTIEAASRFDAYDGLMKVSFTLNFRPHDHAYEYTSGALRMQALATDGDEILWEAPRNGAGAEFLLVPEGSTVALTFMVRSLLERHGQLKHYSFPRATLTYTVSAVPEPSTALSFGVGMLLLTGGVVLRTAGGRQSQRRQDDSAYSLNT